MINITKAYLQQMNESADDKLQMLDYITGNTVLDVGLGGGIMAQLIREHKPHLNVIGIEKEVYTSAPQYVPYDEVIQTDARKMHEVIECGEVDTVIFSSVLHEVYSYNNYSKSAVLEAIESAYNILPKGGRIIIRDGVMMENNSSILLRFKDDRDVEKLVRFADDFKGREIKFSIGHKKDVVIPMNDCMEFLYTYTWGEENYEREVKEQYGIFTPKNYISFIRRSIPMELITYNHYLQEGHNYHLSKKAELFDENGRRVRFPDSNLLMVFQK